MLVWWLYIYTWTLNGYKLKQVYCRHTPCIGRPLGIFCCVFIYKMMYVGLVIVYVHWSIYSRIHIYCVLVPSALISPYCRHTPCIGRRMRWGSGLVPLLTALMKRWRFLSSSYLLISATATGDYITVGVYAWGSVVIFSPSQTPSGPWFGPSQILLMIIISRY